MDLATRRVAAAVTVGVIVDTASIVSVGAGTRVEAEVGLLDGVAVTTRTIGDRVARKVGVEGLRRASELTQIGALNAAQTSRPSKMSPAAPTHKRGRT